MNKNAIYIIIPLIAIIFGLDFSEKFEPLSEIYDGCTVTFDDNSLWTAQCIGDNNFEDDESECILTVEEMHDSRQLRIQVLDMNEDGEYKVPKIKFDVDELIGTENVSKIKSVSLDITACANGFFTGENGSELFVPGNFMGEIDANSGEECAVWTTLAKFEYAEWEKEYIRQNIKGEFLLPKSRYINGEKDCTIVLMRWPIPNQADIYIDNITFFDDDGNPLPLVLE